MKETNIKGGIKIPKEVLFTALHAGYWSFYAAYINYAVTFFLESGISSGTVSLLVSAYFLMAFFGAFLWGEISDLLGTNRVTLIVQSGLSLLLCILIYYQTGNQAVLAILYAALGFAVIPISGNIDSWTLHAFSDDPIKYGKMRAGGSYVYCLVVLLFGWLIRQFGFFMMLIGAAFFLLLLILTSLLIPENQDGKAPVRHKFSAADLRELFSSKEYRRMILVILLVGMTVMPVLSLKILLIENVGGDVGNLGVDSFIGVMVQAPLIALTAGMRNLSIKKKIFLATLAQLGMLVVMALAKNVWMIYLGTSMTNLGYGILLPTMRQNVERYVDFRLRNLAHNVSDAVYSSLSSVLSTPLAGWMHGTIGVRSTMTFFSVIILIPLGMCLVDVIREERRRLP